MREQDQDVPATRAAVSSTADEPPKGSAAGRGRVSRAGSWLAELVIVLVVALAISAILRAFVFQIFEIPSGSMENTLKVNDRVAAVKLKDFQRGDIVVFEDPAGWLPPAPSSTSPARRALELVGLLPDSSKNYLIKRVVGMPGDQVKCCEPDGRITVNGVPLDETSYLYSVNGQQVSPSEMEFDVVVPRDRIFVLGDHRNASGDSRYHLCDAARAGMPQGMTAFPPVSDVVGPAEALVAPLNRITGFSPPSTYANVPDAASAPVAPTITVEGRSCR